MIAVLTDKGYMLSDVPLWYFGHCLSNPRTNGNVRKVSFVEELDGQYSYLLTISGNDMVYAYFQLKPGVAAFDYLYDFKGDNLSGTDMTDMIKRVMSGCVNE
ncbi:hypothetical protein [Lichenihabitans psoromatis]|uniref:hypothetical protein n=1 Tax=Lichenihabitans psoromatis TaxID=2528642 RepID=UPI0010384EEC|nr:hypothetical protein [Lichenihabitans psoromatis]